MKINIKQALAESARISKENFGSIAKIYAVIALLLTVMRLAALRFTPTLLDNPDMYIKYGLIGTVFIIAGAVIVTKLLLGFYIYIDSLIDKNKVRFSDAYRQTKGKFWLAVRCAFLVSLLFVPYLVVNLTNIPVNQLFSLIYSAVVSSLVYVLYPMIAIEPRTDQYLRKSIQMVRGNFFAVFVFTFTTTTFLTTVSDTLAYFFSDTINDILITEMIYALVYFFITSFSSTLNVVVYRKLKENHFSA